jgi:HAD superfamily hydrolase (TIGR01549 family)
MTYDAVVFDNDGVLTHPTDRAVLRRAARAAFAEFDVDPTPDCVEGAVGGDEDRIRTVCARHDVDPVAFWPRREHHAATEQRAAMETGQKPLYGDVGALEELRKPLGVVSNNQHATVEHIVDVFDLDGLFETVYGRDPSLEGFRRRKPETHYLERALADLEAESALYVGDSAVDVAVADRLGLDSAFVRRPHRSDYDLQLAPTYEVESLSDVVALVGDAETDVDAPPVDPDRDARPDTD